MGRGIGPSGTVGTIAAPTPIAPVPRVALTRAEAAASLGVSLDSFDRHIQPELRIIRRGRLRLGQNGRCSSESSATAANTSVR